MFLKPSKLNPNVDTDFASNVRRVSPFLGMLLVASIGLFVLYTIYQSITDLTNSIQSGDAINVSGSLVLTSPSEPKYGSLLTFSSSVSDNAEKNALSYITTICFQDDKLVYQFSAKPGVKFLLVDSLEPGFDWDGGPASCNASLIFRVPKGDKAELYMLDSISFEVGERG